MFRSSLLFFFFFKQKTAYEMRISDWSSDVCSSDLVEDRQQVDIADRAQVERSDDEPFERLIGGENEKREGKAEYAVRPVGCERACLLVRLPGRRRQRTIAQRLELRSPPVMHRMA